MATPQDLNKLSNTFADEPLASHGKKWDSLWRESFTPWDRGGPSFALAEVLTSPTTSPLFQSHAEQQQGKQRPRALVPGCGQGHDVLLLSVLGYDVVGLDVSAEATRKATENEGKNREAVERLVSGMVAERGDKGTVSWITGDFWGDEYLQNVDGKVFDLIFDYTFLCALPPSARPRWAKRMSELLAQDGRLVCLEWPHPSIRDPKTGPPWVLTPELYLALLARPGEDVKYGENGPPELDSTETAPPSETGLKRLAHLTPSETHKAGKTEEGKVLDRVGVWARA